MCSDTGYSRLGDLSTSNRSTLCSRPARRDLENEQQLLASYMRARPGDLGLGPPTARKAASDTRCRSVSHIIAWRLCNSRPATIFSSGYTHLNCLYNSRRTIQFSCGITTILGRLYNVGPAIPCSTGHAILYRLCNYIPESQCPESPCPESQCTRMPLSRESMLGIFALDI